MLAVRKAYDKMPSGLPACLWRPASFCKNSTPFECIEGENIHACSAENWFDLLPPEKKTASAKHAGSQGAKDAKDEKAAATDTKSSKASPSPNPNPNPNPDPDPNPYPDPYPDPDPDPIPNPNPNPNP